MLFQCCLFTCLFSIVHCIVPKSYEGWSAIKIQPASEVHIELLHEIVKNGTEAILAKRGTRTVPFYIFVSPSHQQSFMAILDEFGIPYNVTVQNIQQAIEEELSPGGHPIHKRSSTYNITNENWFTNFLTLHEMNTFLREIANRYQNIMKLDKIGKSHENRKIPLIKISSGGNESKPAIWIDAGIHPREWISHMTALYIINELVTNYESNGTLIDQADFYIVPVVNPDGYVFTHTQDRMWRKNRRPKECTITRAGQRVKCGCTGVDLNRNFDYDFGGIATSENSCEENYGGPNAFTEPESQAIRDFIINHKNIKAYISLHSYSQMWFYPFGNQANSTPEDVAELASVAKKGAEVLKSLYGTEYQVGTAADLLYPAAGGSDDWAKAVANVKYVYTLELRPSDDDAVTGFILHPSEIIPTGKETWAGLRVLFDAVINNFGNTRESG